MTRLDRYIARQYLVNVAALFALLCTFIVAVDVVLHLSRFVSAGERLSGGSSGVRHAAATLLLVIDLWGPRLLQLFGHLYGMVLVAAMGFTCAQLVRRRELVAALASGLSLHRLARPILLVALAVTGVHAVNQEYFVPAVAHLLVRDSSDALRRTLAPFEVALVRDGTGRVVYAREFDAASGRLTEVHAWERDAAGRIVRRVRADAAAWDGAGWALEHGRTVGGAAGARAAAVERLDTDLDPTALVVRRYEGYGQNLSWRQIRKTVTSRALDDASRERFERVLYGRVSTMVCNLLALAIALPFFLVREPRNMVTQTTRCAPVAGLALIAAAVGPSIAAPGLPVWLGVFIPALALAPIALAAAVSVRT